MRKTQLPVEARASFEALKQTNEHDLEHHFAGAGKMVGLITLVAGS